VAFLCPCRSEEEATVSEKMDRPKVVGCVLVECGRAVEEDGYPELCIGLGEGLCGQPGRRGAGLLLAVPELRQE